MAPKYDLRFGEVVHDEVAMRAQVWCTWVMLKRKRIKFPWKGKLKYPSVVHLVVVEEETNKVSLDGEIEVPTCCILG